MGVDTVTNLIFGQAQQGSVWAVGALSSTIAVSIYHKVTQVPQAQRRDMSLANIDKGISDILEKLKNIETKVQSVEQDNAFIKGKLDLDK